MWTPGRETTQERKKLYFYAAEIGVQRLQVEWERKSERVRERESEKERERARE